LCRRAAAATVRAANVQTLRSQSVRETSSLWWGGEGSEGRTGEQEERKTGGKTESHQGRDQEGRSVRARARARTLVCVPCSECTEQALLVRGHLSYDRSVPTLPAGAPASCLPPANLPPGSTDCPLLRPSTFTTAILPRTEPVGSSSFKPGTHARGCTRYLERRWRTDSGIDQASSPTDGEEFLLFS